MSLHRYYVTVYDLREHRSLSSFIDAHTAADALTIAEFRCARSAQRSANGQLYDPTSYVTGIECVPPLAPAVAADGRRGRAGE